MSCHLVYIICRRIKIFSVISVVNIYWGDTEITSHSLSPHFWREQKKYFQDLDFEPKKRKMSVRFHSTFNQPSWETGLII